MTEDELKAYLSGIAAKWRKVRKPQMQHFNRLVRLGKWNLAHGNCERVRQIFDELETLGHDIANEDLKRYLANGLNKPPSDESASPSGSAD